MDRSTPQQAVEALVAARGRQDVEGAMSFYEPGATIVLEPGKTVSGSEAIKAFVEATIGLPTTFGNRTVVESGDLALHLSEWTITQPDEAGGTRRITGRTTDVLRKQSDGSWRMVIDNPWGVALLDKPEIQSP